jgi:hypothetical protein
MPASIDGPASEMYPFEVATSGSMHNEAPGESARGIKAAEIISETALVGVLGSIHPALGVLGSTMAALRQSRLLPRWLTFLDRDLAAAGVVLDPNDPNTEAMFNRLTFSALQTARTEKWEMLAGALQNSAAPPSSPDFLVEHFADLVIRFTPEHIRVMQIVASPAKHGINLEGLDSSQLLAALASDVSDESREDLSLVIDVVWNDLVLNDLAHPRFMTRFTQVLGNDDHDPGDSGLSEKGLRFLAHIRAGE